MRWIRSILGRRRKLSLRRKNSLPPRVEKLEDRVNPSTLIPLTGVQDLVYDSMRGQLLIGTESGVLQRYDPAAQTLLTPLSVGTRLNGMDITADGAFLYVAEDDFSGGMGRIRKVNLSTGATNTLTYSLTLQEEGAWDIVVMSNGRALFVAREDNFGGRVPIRQIQLSTDGLSIRPDAPGAWSEIYHSASLNRSADRSLMFATEPGVTPAPMFTYDAATDAFSPSSRPNNSFDNVLSAVSRDGRLIATELPTGGLEIRNRTLGLVRTMADLDGGVAFDPQLDILYAVDSSADQLIAYDAVAWHERFRLPVGENVGPSVTFGSGVMTVSSDRRWLFLSTPSGVRVFDLPRQVQVRDDGDAGFTTTGSWTPTPGAGYQGDATVRAGTGVDTASWTFTGLTPGTYRVSTTWTTDAGRSGSVAYTVLDGATVVSSTTIDQRAAPNDFTELGVGWEDLGNVHTITGGALTVRLSVSGAGSAAADAVRIDRLGDLPPRGEIQVLLNSVEIPHGGTVSFPSTTAGAPVGFTFTVKNLGPGLLTLDPNIMLPGGFSLQSTFDRTVLQRNEMTTFFVSLSALAGGTYSGLAHFATDDPDENPFSFTVSGTVAASNAVQVIDDADVTGIPSFSVEGAGWETLTVGFQGGSRRHPASSSAGFRATWMFTGLTPGLYRISTTWVPGTDRSATATYSIYDGLSFPAPPGQLLATIPINQQLAPDDFSDRGANWENLRSSILISSNSLEVRLQVSTGGAVIADAVRIEGIGPVRMEPEIQVITQTVPPVEVYSRSGAPSFPTTLLGVTNSKSYVVRNLGTTPLILNPNITVGSGFTITSGFTTTTVPPGETTSFTVRMNATLPGEVFELVSFGTNDSDENPFHFFVGGRVNVTSPRMAVLDGTTPLYDSTDVSNPATVLLGNTPLGVPVTRVITVRNPGSAPLVLNPNIQLPAGFSLAAGLGATVLAPGASTTFTVRMNAATAGSFHGLVTILGNSVIDPRIGFLIAGTVGTPQPEVHMNLLPDGIGTQSSHADTLFFGVMNIGSAPLALIGPINLPHHFIVQSSFGSTLLAPGASTNFGIHLAPPSSGFYSGEVSFATNDPDEVIYSFTVVVHVGAHRPEIQVLDGAADLTDESAWSSFGLTTVGNPVLKTFTIRNVGTSLLTLDSPVRVPEGFTVVSGPGSRILAPAQSTTFTVRLDAAAAGTFSGQASFRNGDSDENRFAFNLSGSVDAPAPEIQVLDGIQDVLALSTAFFGTEATGQSSKTFTVRNVGTAPLVLSSPIEVPYGFSVESGFGATSLAPGASTTFTLLYDADLIPTGVIFGEVAFGTNDADESVFRFGVQRTVLSPPDTPVYRDDSPSGGTPGAIFGGPWQTSLGEGYRGGARYTDQPAQWAQALWSSGNPTPGVYRIWATWPSGADRTDAAEYTVEEGNVAQGRRVIDQRQSPNDLADQGVMWEELGGPYTVIGGGGLLVRLVNRGTGLLYADAIRLVPVPIPPNTPDIQVLDDIFDVADDVGVVPFGTLAPAERSDRTFLIRNVGSATLTLTTPFSLPAGVTLVSGPALTSLPPGGSTTFVIRFQPTVPGSYSGQLSFGTNDPNENPFNITLTAAVVDPLLEVASFTSTNTGFVVRFNRPIDRSVLNVFDAQTGGLGPADVLLTGPGGVPVRGSVVAAPDSRSITFVRTGGVLPAGSYSVVLRSAANGFRDSLGQALDGDGDGVSGGDYSTEFTVADANYVISVPDFVRGPGQQVNVPASSLKLPLRITSAFSWGDIELRLRFNPHLLSITEASLAPGLPASASLYVLYAVAGELYIRFSIPGLPAGTHDFVVLTANVPSSTGTSYAQKHVLDLTDLRVNTSSSPVRDDDGVHVVAYAGDASGNAGYSSSDALRSLRVAVGLDSGFERYPLADPRLIADVTGDGALNATDATRLLQAALGLEPPAITPLPPNPPTIVTGGPDPLLRFPGRLRGRRGDTIRVPLLLEPSDGLATADLAIAYDADRLQVMEVRRGRLTHDFDLFGTRIDPASGTIHIGLGRSAGPIAGRGSGSIIEVIFQVRPDAPAGRAVVNLRQSLRAAPTQLNEGGLDLHPKPRDEAGDELDGAIEVQRRIQRIDEFFRRYRDVSLAVQGRRARGR